MSTLSQQRLATSPSRRPDVAPRRTAPRQSPRAASTSLAASCVVKGSRPGFAVLSFRCSTAATGLMGIKPNLCALSKGAFSILLIELQVATERPSARSLFRKAMMSPGDTAAIERIADLNQFATSLAEFLLALQQIDATGGPAPGPHNFFRGGSPAYYDREARQAIATLGDRIDGKAATAIGSLANSAACVPDSMMRGPAISPWA